MPPIDYKNYHPEWHTVIRPAILARAQNKCEWCGVPNGAMIIRGTIDGIPAYLDTDGVIYDAGNGEELASISSSMDFDPTKEHKIYLRYENIRISNCRNDEGKAECRHLCVDLDLRILALSRPNC